MAMNIPRAAVGAALFVRAAFNAQMEKAVQAALLAKMKNPATSETCGSSKNGGKRQTVAQNRRLAAKKRNVRRNKAAHKG